jgi:hypothetical protein
VNLSSVGLACGRVRGYPVPTRRGSRTERAGQMDDGFGFSDEVRRVEHEEVARVTIGEDEGENTIGADEGENSSVILGRRRP